MMTDLRSFLLVLLMLETAGGLGIGALLNCRNGLDRWTTGVTGPEICKLVNRMFDGGRIRKKGDEYDRVEGKDWDKRIGNGIWIDVFGSHGIWADES